MQDNATLLKKRVQWREGVIKILFSSIQFSSVQNQVVWRAAILQALGGGGVEGA